MYFKQSTNMTINDIKIHFMKPTIQSCGLEVMSRTENEEVAGSKLSNTFELDFAWMRM